jgi:hypothetical protein
MRCVFADTDPTFLAELKRCFKYTPVSPDQYPLVVRGHASTAWNAVPPQSVAWLVTPGEDENRLRLEVEGSEGVRLKLHCPAAQGWNARQLVRAVLKHVGTHGGHVDFLLIPRMGDGSAAVARSMHAGYVEGVTKKSSSV